MADNVLATLFSNIAEAIRTHLDDKSVTFAPAAFPEAIKNIVSGSGGTGGGTGGGTETGVGDLKIKHGTFNSGTGYRKTVNHGLGKTPDIVVAYYGNQDWTYDPVTFSKMELYFAIGINSSLQGLTSYKGCAQSFGTGTVQTSHYMDEDGFVSNTHIYCTDEDTFSWGCANDGSNTNGNGLMVANKTYQWLAISGMGGVIGEVYPTAENFTF